MEEMTNQTKPTDCIIQVYQQTSLQGLVFIFISLIVNLVLVNTLPCQEACCCCCYKVQSDLPPFRVFQFLSRPPSSPPPAAQPEQETQTKQNKKRPTPKTPLS